MPMCAVADPTGGPSSRTAASHSGSIGGGQIDGLADPSSTVIVAFPGSAAFAPIQIGYSRALDTLDTVRGRVGYLSSPNLLW
jgi:hypothetical protein